MTVGRRIIKLFSRSRVEEEIRAEIETHIAMRTADNMAAGQVPDEARRNALLRFGNPTVVQGQTTESDIPLGFDATLRNVRFGFRQLLRHRGFAISAVLTLAFGIGATVGIYSILNAWLFKPLPLKDPSRLFVFWRASLSAPNEPLYFYNWVDYLYFRQHSQTFTSLAASFHRTYALTGDGQPETVVGAVATQSLFATLGVAPFLGRLFAPYDETGVPVAVISHSLWTQRYHQSDAVLGKTITLNDKPFKIVGVLPPKFSYRLLDQARDTRVWTLIQQGDPQYKPDSVAAVGIVGRLEAGVTPNQAQSEIAILQQQNDLRYPGFKTASLVVGLQQDNTRTVRSSLLILGGAVSLLLVIACTNVASLILGRSLQRQREFAIRSALGASTKQLLLQLITESAVLYGLSGGLGLAIAFGLVRGIVVWNPFRVLPPNSITLNWTVLTIAAVLTLLFSSCFGAYPAFRIQQTEGRIGLRSGMTLFAGRHQLKTRYIIVTSQIALSLVLLVGAYLLMATYLRLSDEAHGFNIANTQVVQLSLPKRHYGMDEQLVRFSDQLLQRFSRLPEAEAVGMTLAPILERQQAFPFQIEGRSNADKNHTPEATMQSVDAGFFEAMGIPVLRGRNFLSGDRRSTQRVALINEEVARRYFPTTNPLGQHVHFEDSKDQVIQRSSWFEIVGVVGVTKSIHYNQIAAQSSPEIYTNVRQVPFHPFSANWDSTQMNFVIHTKLHTKASEASLQRAVSDVDPNLPIAETRSLDEMLAEIQTQPRVRAQLLAIFACFTLLLAAMGIYGVMAQTVIQRQQEIGIRMAVGADRRGVLVLVLKQAFVLALSGVAIGLVIAIASARLIRAVLYEVSTANPLAYATMCLIIFLITFLASLLPARRAASIDPTQALRTE